jgi:predicted nucleic acid-binding protein
LLDALIANTVLEWQVALYTFNQKHYAPIAALTTVQLYLKIVS